MATPKFPRPWSLDIWRPQISEHYLIRIKAFDGSEVLPPVEFSHDIRERYEAICEAVTTDDCSQAIEGYQRSLDYAHAETERVRALFQKEVAMRDEKIADLEIVNQELKKLANIKVERVKLKRLG